uniref:Uncharacterized protein n=1 Tax=Anguilla anguilla TaxID=7936 RepID=A0A0E9WFS2_ANGAN
MLKNIECTQKVMLFTFHSGTMRGGCILYIYCMRTSSQFLV